MSASSGRLVRAWRALPYERRLAAGAAIGLFVTLFLPWYQETVIVGTRSGTIQHASAPLTGWAAFSFVEAAVLLVAAGVLTLLFQRAEGRAFHLPGGDGWVLTVAGAWTCVLIVWRIFDKQTTQVSGPGVTASGVEWGIFAALGVAALLTYAGSLVRRAGTLEPPLPDEDIDFSLPRRGRVRREPEFRASRRSRSTRAAIDFPAPEPLADPPTLHFDRPVPAPAPPPTDPSTQVTEEQLTIPLDDADASPRGDA